jgi:hypothetical protein
MMNEMKKKMDENKEEIQKSMKSIETILLQRIPKRDMEIQGNHENKENNGVETQSHMGSILSHLESTNIESQNHDHSSLQDPHHQVFKSTPRNYFIPKIDMRKVESKNMATRRVVTNNYREHHAPSPYLTQPTRLTPQQMDERREKGLCFNCDRKYSKGHKCSEKKVFYIDNEEEEDQELEPSQDLELEETTPMISCHALVNISTPQTLKIEGYIKKKKVTMLIDSGSTHNFINYKLAKFLNCFVFPTPEFQVMIADGGIINCSGKCHSIKLNMGEYLLDSPMIAIQMGGVDVVLGVQWLQSLGTMALNFQDLFMRFSSRRKGN